MNIIFEGGNVPPDRMRRVYELLDRYRYLTEKPPVQSDIEIDTESESEVSLPNSFHPSPED